MGFNSGFKGLSEVGETAIRLQ